MNHYREVLEIKDFIDKLIKTSPVSVNTICREAFQKYGRSPLFVRRYLKLLEADFFIEIKADIISIPVKVQEELDKQILLKKEAEAEADRILKGGE